MVSFIKVDRNSTYAGTVNVPTLHEMEENYTYILRYADLIDPTKQTYT